MKEGITLMNQMSLRAILTVSMPECLMFILLTLVVTNRLDVINIKKPEKLIRLLIALTLTTAVPPIMRLYSDIFTFNLMVQSVVFIIIYILVLKLEWYNASIGFLVTFMTSILFEIITIIGTVSITKIPYESMYTDDNIRFFFSIPQRLINVVIFLLLLFLLRKYEFSIIRIKIFKFTIIKLKKLSMLHALLVICSVNILQTGMYCLFNMREGVVNTEIKHMVSSVFLTLLISVIVVIISSKFSKIIENEQNNHLHSLLLIRTLLSSNDYDKVNNEKIINIINNSINDVGGR